MRYGTEREEGRGGGGGEMGRGQSPSCAFFLLFSQLGWLRRILP